MKNKAYLYLVTAYLLWATMLIVQKIMLNDGIQPLLIVCARFFIALPALVFFTRHLPKPKIEKKDIKHFLVIGAVGYMGSTLLNLFSLRFVGASVASLLVSLSPAFISVMAVFLLKERFTRMKLLCLVLGVSGAVASVGAVSGGNALGVVLMAGSQLVWAYSTCIVRRLSDRYHPLIITRYALTFSLILNVPALTCSIATGGLEGLVLKDLLWFLYLGVCCTATTLVLWNKSLAILDASSCSLFATLQPVFVTTMGVLILHETVGISFVVSAVLILSSVILNVLVGSGRVPDAPLFFRQAGKENGMLEPSPHAIMTLYGRTLERESFLYATDSIFCVDKCAKI